MCRKSAGHSSGNQKRVSDPVQVLDGDGNNNFIGKYRAKIKTPWQNYNGFIREEDWKAFMDNDQESRRIELDSDNGHRFAVEDALLLAVEKDKEHGTCCLIGASVVNVLSITMTMRFDRDVK